MSEKRSSPTRELAAVKLRQHILSVHDGDRLGNEDDLINLLGVSRNTVRQVARLIEREGLLRVKRGNNGGYFASRPDAKIITSSVSAYLEVFNADDEEATEIASLLWVFAVCKACRKKQASSKTAISALKNQVMNVGDDSGFDDVLSVEENIRSQVFKMIKSPYIDLMFQINRAFAEHHFPSIPAALDNTPEHRGFVQQWKKTKLLELQAIADGDSELGELAATRSRQLFHARVWGGKREN